MVWLIVAGSATDRRICGGHSETGTARMATTVPTRRSLVFGGLSVSALNLVGCGPNDGPSPVVRADSGIGVLVLHGKQGSPLDRSTMAMRRAFGPIGMIAAPDMPWSTTRYLTGTAEQALDNMAREIDALRRRGATKVFVAGHSMGGNFALSFAANRGGLAGVAMFAPGHYPAGFATDPTVREAILRAQRMVAEQRGGEIAGFVDINTGGPQPVVMPAADYLTWLSPRGAASMGTSANRLPPGIPVFVAIGTRDSEGLNTGARRVFAVLPRDPRHRFIEVDGNHDGVPLAASGAAQAWALEVASGSAGS